MSSLIVEVCEVKEVRKHENADSLSVIKVKGWNCVTMLDQYRVGDLILFIPPDSIVPPDMIEKYKLDYLKKNGRVRTVKLRKVISEGLVLDLPEGNFKKGDDLAELLGITKYEQPESKPQKGGNRVSKKRLNPMFHKYTSIENSKNYEGIFEEGELVVITEKIHGSNWRAGYLAISIHKDQPFRYKVQKFFEKYVLRRTQEFVYGSHNVQLHSGNKRNNFYKDDIWIKMAKKYGFDEIKEENTVFYGEVYGLGIQDLTYGLNEVSLVIFDIKKNGEYVTWNEVVEICSKYNLPTVPVLYAGQWHENITDEYAGGNSLLYSTQLREGCVVKPTKEKSHPSIGRKILKVINPEYLARKKGTEFK